MKILLLGEYSNVHWTLAEGLRALGHEVTVVSGGDYWKGYKADVELYRRSLGLIDSLSYFLKVERIIPALKGYDVVQIINPIFLDLKAERILPFYKKLRKNNGKIFLGAFGIDKVWVEEGLKKDTFKYGDFYIYGTKRNTPEVEAMKSWLMGAKASLNDYIVEDSDGIIAGLYEYDVCYRNKYKDKLTFIPFPINHNNLTLKQPKQEPLPIRFFVGIQKTRSSYKGTDIMLDALKTLKKRYPKEMEIQEVENVPYFEYEKMLSSFDVLLDQLYSYTPAMNALMAMAKGIVVVGGGEEEQYEHLGEKTLRPIINVRPSKEDVINQIEQQLLKTPENLERLSKESMLYTRRWHDHVKVAQLYIDAWMS